MTWILPKDIIYEIAEYSDSPELLVKLSNGKNKRNHYTKSLKKLFEWTDENDSFNYQSVKDEDLDYVFICAYKAFEYLSNSHREDYDYKKLIDFGDMDVLYYCFDLDEPHEVGNKSVFEFFNSLTIRKSGAMRNMGYSTFQLNMHLHPDLLLYIERKTSFDFMKECFEKATEYYHGDNYHELIYNLIKKLRS